jgi:hypothetical protein
MSGFSSVDRSVWYSGWLLTFLAAAEETQGRFALIEAVARKSNVPPPHIHHWEEETMMAAAPKFGIEFALPKQ